MEIDLNCPRCLTDYRENNPPRLLNCGHTFCHSCLAGLLDTQEEPSSLICPEDQQSVPVVSLEQLPKNIALLKLLEGRKKNNSNSSSSMRDASFDMSKINKQEEFQEDEVAEELISEINRASEAREEDVLLSPLPAAKVGADDVQIEAKVVVVKSPDREEVELCLLHQKPIEVVCMNDYERLCSKCALFGEHKNHDFKGVEEIECQNRKCYQEVIKIFEEKATFMEGVGNRTVERDLKQLLAVKTTRVKREITDKFKKMAEELVKAESSALKKVEEMTSVIELRLQTSLKPDEGVNHSYDCWEGLTLEVIQESEKPSSEGHMRFFIKREEIVLEGKQLLQQLQKMQEVAHSNSVQVIEDFSIAFQDTGFQAVVGNMVDVIDRNKEEAQKKSKHSKLKENQGTFANCEFEAVKKSPHHHRHESEQSLLDACQFDTQSFAGSTVGSRILDESFVSVRQESFAQPKDHHHREVVSRPLIKRKAPVVREKEKFLIKEGPTNASLHSNVKRKLKALKVPEKYEKVIEGIISDSLQVVDLTNAELGDNIVLHILQLMKDNTKVRTLKLIRNKLTDDGLCKMIPFFGNIVSLNLSQNQLTDHSLSLIIDNRPSLPLLRSVVLSQTKIIERKSKSIIERLRKMEVGVSV